MSEVEVVEVASPAPDAAGTDALHGPETIAREFLRRRRAAAEQAAADVERRFLERALRRSRGNVTQAVRECGISRAFFYKLLDRLDIDPDLYR